MRQNEFVERLSDFSKVFWWQEEEYVLFSGRKKLGLVVMPPGIPSFIFHAEVLVLPPSGKNI
jgi:hypothetical protein